MHGAFDHVAMKHVATTTAILYTNDKKQGPALAKPSKDQTMELSSPGEGGHNNVLEPEIEPMARDIQSGVESMNTSAGRKKIKTSRYVEETTQK